MKKNDKVITHAGIYGKIISVAEKEDEIVVEIDDKVRVKMVKNAILRNLTNEEAFKEAEAAKKAAKEAPRRQKSGKPAEQPASTAVTTKEGRIPSASRRNASGLVPRNEPTKGMKSDHETVSRPNYPLRHSRPRRHHRRRLGLRQYVNGEGGFRLGVDLSGGTILVYEMDLSRMTEQAKDFDPEQLAASLKHRIDPADLYNVTIRPVPGDPPRVEIILPTGGRVQQAAAEGVAGRARQGQSRVPDLPIFLQRHPEGQFTS